jgi:hypothetical protein
MFRIDSKALKTDADEFAKDLQAECLGAGAHYIAQCIYEYPVPVDHSAFDLIMARECVLRTHLF